MRFLPTRVHGAIDYLWGAGLIGLPFALGLPLGGGTSWVAFLFGAGAVLYSAFTAYEFGLVRLLPMPLHLGLDGIAGLVLAALPLMVSFEGAAGSIFMAFGLFSVLASLVTRTRPDAPASGALR